MNEVKLNDLFKKAILTEGVHSLQMELFVYDWFRKNAKMIIEDAITSDISISRLEELFIDWKNDIYNIRPITFRSRDFKYDGPYSISITLEKQNNTAFSTELMVFSILIDSRFKHWDQSIKMPRINVSIPITIYHDMNKKELTDLMVENIMEHFNRKYSIIKSELMDVERSFLLIQSNILMYKIDEDNPVMTRGDSGIIF